MEGWEPFVFPNVDKMLISNSPPCSTTKDLKAIENTPSSEGGAATKISMENVTK